MNWFKRALCAIKGRHVFLVPRWSQKANQRRFNTFNCACIRCGAKAQILRRYNGQAVEAA